MTPGIAVLQWHMNPKISLMVDYFKRCHRIACPSMASLMIRIAQQDRDLERHDRQRAKMERERKKLGEQIADYASLQTGAQRFTKLIDAYTKGDNVFVDIASGTTKEKIDEWCKNHSIRRTEYYLCYDTSAIPMRYFAPDKSTPVLAVLLARKHEKLAVLLRLTHG